MSDVPVFESPIVKAYPDGGVGPLTLADESSTAKTLVRAAADTPAAAQLGVRFGASRRDGDVLVCGQRPGEWMLLGTAEGNEAFLGALDRSGHVSVIDHTHSRALFGLTGSQAPAVLEKVCSLDWSEAMTPDGAVVSASVAKVTCDLVRDDRDGEASYRIACDRSYGQYLFDALLDAGNEYGILVAA